MKEYMRELLAASLLTAVLQMGCPGGQELDRALEYADELMEKSRERPNKSTKSRG